MRDGFEKSDRVVVRERPERLVNTFDMSLKYQDVIIVLFFNIFGITFQIVVS